MLLRLHREIKEAAGGREGAASCCPFSFFGLFSLHASLGDATSVRSAAKSDPRALLGGERIPALRCLRDFGASRLQNKSPIVGGKLRPRMPPRRAIPETSRDFYFHLEKLKRNLVFFGRACALSQMCRDGDVSRKKKTHIRSESLQVEVRRESPNRLKRSKPELGYPSMCLDSVVEVMGRGNGKVLK